MVDYTELYLSWTQILVRIGFSLLAGVIIGIEREISNHSAGMRTHALVCVGSALASLISCEMAGNITMFNPARVDISRIAAGVITGIGFLGAGAIIKTKQHSYIYGLTTAATLWVTGCLGLSIGMGYYKMSLITLVTIMITIVTLKIIENKLISARSTKTITLSFINQNEFVSFIDSYCSRRHIQIMSIRYFGSKDSLTDAGERIYNCTYTIKLPRNIELKEIVNDWSLQEYIIEVSSESNK